MYSSQNKKKRIRRNQGERPSVDKANETSFCLSLPRNLLFVTVFDGKITHLPRILDIRSIFMEYSQESFRFSDEPNTNSFSQITNSQKHNKTSLGHQS